MKSQTTFDYEPTEEGRLEETTALDLLREIYLSAGLSPENANRSAHADYVCNFLRDSAGAA